MTATDVPLVGKLAGVVAGLENPPLDAKGAHGAKYTSLGALTNHLRGPCAAAGIAISFELQSTAGEVTTSLSVIDVAFGGVLPVGSLTLPYRDAQQMGGCVTYARRYLLAAAFGVVGENDDDGARASKPATVRKARQSGAEPSEHDRGVSAPEPTISAAQLKALQARYSGMDRGDRLADWSSKLNRKIETANELSRREAITLLTEEEEETR